MYDNNISYYYLNNMGMDNSTLHQIRHDRSVTMKTLNKLCKIMNCQPGDLIKYVPDPEEE